MPRIAVIDKEKCINGTKCAFLCSNVCPVNRAGKQCITLDEDNKPIISEELCIGCGICQKKCPASCITIINLASEKLQTPLHKFGENAFRLYGLPVPQKNAVVGLLGKNGIGKTTVLNILSGNIVPNLGNPKEKPSYKKVIEFFKGKETQAFFTALSQGKKGLSFKPQNVDAIAEKFKGKTGELLKKTGNLEKLKGLARELEIDSILNHEISKLSGGELQRVAIAAAMIKDAELFFFDEPSSYLDVRQRLRVAKLIRKLGEQGKQVVVVEHDLAVLDYLSDYIYVMYGAPQAYGVVGNPKSTLNGINEFLEGFLHDENIRFREKELRFSVRAVQKQSKATVIAKYPRIKKTLGCFSIEASPGELCKGTVIGILGPNAIGKTTLMKIFAGELKPDNTTLSFALKIAYKPQYLKPNPTTLVSDLFNKAIDKELFTQEIDRRLKIKPLFERKLGQLSGGELQKVSVAYNLALESDLVLLDEPSAFIDVEDRLLVADAVRSVVDVKEKIAVVVDHDILFQDYVSDSLIVFSGQPARKGIASPPLPKEKAMNMFLQEMNITFRRDPATGRPRANKPDSQKDKEQKKAGKYYYQ